MVTAFTIAPNTADLGRVTGPILDPLINNKIVFYQTMIKRDSRKPVFGGLRTTANFLEGYPCCLISDFVIRLLKSIISNVTVLASLHDRYLSRQ